MVTYLTFDAVALGVPIVLLTLVARRSLSARRLGTVGLLIVVTVVYATPWDNYLVSRGLWWSGSGVVHARLGRVPLGEYAIFVLQPLLVGLWFYARSPEIEAEIGAIPIPTRAVGAGLWLVLTLAGGGALTTESGQYLGALLLWLGPILALAWAFGGPALWRDRRLQLQALVGPTLYLWLLDGAAIGLGVWAIDPDTTIGLAVGPVPIEELLFFLLTTAVLVHALVLLEWAFERIQTAHAN